MSGLIGKASTSNTLPMSLLQGLTTTYIYYGAVKATSLLAIQIESLFLCFLITVVVQFADIRSTVSLLGPGYESQPLLLPFSSGAEIKSARCSVAASTAARLQAPTGPTGQFSLQSGTVESLHRLIARCLSAPYVILNCQSPAVYLFSPPSFPANCKLLLYGVTPLPLN